MDEREYVRRQNMLAEIGRFYRELRIYTLRYGRNHLDSMQSEFYRKLCSLRVLRNGTGYRDALSKIDTEGLARYRNMVRDLLSLLVGNRINNISPLDVTMREGDFYEEYIQRQIEMQVERRNYAWDIYAIKSGTVIATTKADESVYGNSLIIRDSDGVVARYAHLVGLKLNVGSNVTEGQVIGVMGNTGRGLPRPNKHLHVSVYPAGTPEEWLSRYATINPGEYIRDGTYPCNTKISTGFRVEIGDGANRYLHEGLDFSGLVSNLIQDWQRGISGIDGIEGNN
jgi:hypothetical protein